MSHVDEGALHAYLDGALDDLPASEAARIRAHLASCEKCSARLEGERVLRDEVSAILAVASPAAGDLPAFEELRAKSGASRAVAAGHRLRRLAWAASVVLALGSGWMLRGVPATSIVGRMGTAAADETARGGGEVARAEEAKELAPETPASSSMGAVEAGVAAAVGVEEASQDALVAATERDVFLRPAEVPDGPAPAVAQTSSERLGSVATGAAPAPAKLADDAPVLGAARDELARVGADAATVRTTDAAAVTPSSAPSTSSGAPSSYQRGAQPALPPLTEQARQRTANSDLTAPRALADAVERRDQRLGGPAAAVDAAESLVVPGLTVLSVSWLESDPVGAVQVLQLLESGDTLELVHLPGTTSPSMLPPLADDGRTGLVLPRGDGWLVVRARASQAELEGLVRRMSGGR